MNGLHQQNGRNAMGDKERPAPGWHRLRAAQERELADRSGGPAAHDRHRRLADLHERAADHGYALQMVEDQ